MEKNFHGEGFVLYLEGKSWQNADHCDTCKTWTISSIIALLQSLFMNG